MDILKRLEVLKPNTEGYMKNDDLRQKIKELGGSVSNKMRREELISILKSLIISSAPTVQTLVSEEELNAIVTERPIITKGIYDENKHWFYLLIAGSRTYTDFTTFSYIVNQMLSQVSVNYNICIVSGGATGADTLAKQYAKDNNYTFAEFPAEWDKHGKSAGFKRNAEMHNFILRAEKRGCLCFWDGESKGTQHNFDLAKENETPLKVFNYVLRQWYKKGE